jgi:hypothetical protein
MQAKNTPASALPIVLLLLSATSAAQKMPDDDVDVPQEKPWSKGVPLEARTAASELFQEGRKLYRESLFVLAAEKYRAALARCNCHHPAIHYNLMLSLVNLDRPIEMYENLMASMENGLAILSKERFEQAKNFKVLLEKQLVALDVRCDVPGAKVTFDGRPLLESPGRFNGMVRPGLHTILAAKDGMVPNQVLRQLDGGQKVALNLELKSEEELTVYERRWPAWKPWAVVGAGSAVALVGAGLYYVGRTKATSSDDPMRSQCPEGCRLPPLGQEQQRADGERLQKLALGAFALGGAAILTGAVLGYLNRPQTTLRRYEPDVSTAAVPAVSIAPLLDKDARGVVAAGTF